MHVYIAPIYLYDYRFAESFVGFEQIISPVDPNVLLKKKCQFGFLQKKDDLHFNR